MSKVIISCAFYFFIYPHMITLQQFFNKGLELAIKHDPRPKKEVEQLLKERKKDFEKLDEKEKKYFDMESLKNPYLDSRILVGDPRTVMKRVMVGIDITIGELLLAKELNRSGKKIDVVLAHHPEGRALVDLTKVMPVQEDIAVSEGVAVNVAEKMLRVRMNEIDRSLHAANHYAVTDAASLLGITMACFHTIPDNLCHWFLKGYIEKKKPKYVGEVIDILMELPEYQKAAAMGVPPKIFVGDKNAKLGKMSFSGFTGGTSGPKDIYEKMSAAGVGTVFGMHIPEEHRKLAEKHHLNVLIFGHMASDSLGYNLLLDEAEKKGTEIVPCGGFIRVSRVKKGFRI
jgi:putative NIF3 family GTP cyclohydrolase 1 type 2